MILPFVFLSYALVAVHASLLSSWMANVPDTTLITQLSIPGVYSTTPSSLYTSFAQGARAIDVRLSPYGTDFHLNQDEVSAEAIVTLSTVFDKSIQFLQLHPTESLLFVMRSDQFITDDLLDFLYRYRQFVYADDWKEGVPSMKALRGKIWLLSSLDEMEGVSPWISWETNAKSREGTHTTGKYLVEDFQKVPLASYESIVESKLNAITKNLGAAYSSIDKNDLFLTYTSISSNSRYSSLDFIDGIWPTEGLHSQLSTFLDTPTISRNTRAGIVIMDWNNDPSILTEKLIRPYLSGDGKLRLQLE